MIPNANTIANALLINAQIPLDGKTFFLTLNELKDLGNGNVNAFTYYEGMPAYCNEDKTKYVWRQVLEVESEENPGLIVGHYTYPAGVTTKGISYSGKTFNFFKEDMVKSSELETILQSLLVQILGFKQAVGITQEDYDALVLAQTDDPEILYLIPCGQPA